MERRRAAVEICLLAEWRGHRCGYRGHRELWSKFKYVQTRVTTHQ